MKSAKDGLDGRGPGDRHLVSPDDLAWRCPPSRFSFETTDDACAQIGAVVGDYEHHSRAARAIAEEYFDASRVLPSLLERVGVHG